MSVAVYKAIGRRKDSVARVNMMPGKGEIIVNLSPYTHLTLPTIA